MTTFSPASSRARRSTPTLASIARLAGVSHSTVSLILNERGQELRIHPETEARVRQIARELNYVPNQLARGLRGLKTQAIGVLWSLCGPHPSEGIARTITLLAQQHAYTVHLADSLSDAGVVVKMLEDLARRRIDGVVVQLNFPHLQSSEIIERLHAFPATVVVSTAPLEGTSLDHIVQSPLPAFEQIVTALVAAGRSRIGLLGNHPHKVSLFQNLMRRLGHTPPTVIPFGEELAPYAPEDCKAFLDKQPPDVRDLDAVLCNNDDLAAGLMRHLAERGIHVPGDLAVIGYNDSPFAPFLTPPLASVRRHDRDVAERAVELLFERLEQPDREPRAIDIPMTFVARVSSGLPVSASLHQP